MNSQSGVMEPVTPAPSSELARYRRAEDSGYTSFTPGSIECSEVSNENLDPHSTKHHNDIAPEVHRRDRRCRRYKASVANNDQQSPTKRRATKRPYQEDANTSDLSFNSIPTPTSVIAKRIQRLEVDDEFDSSIAHTSLITEYSGSISMETISCTTSNTATPVKSCPLRTINNLCCSVRRSPKKLNFACHSLPGEIYVSQDNDPPLNIGKASFRPDQKVDILRMLYYEVRTMPALKKIFGYLSNEDVYNYSKVSSTCLQICKLVPEAKVKKDNHEIYKTITKENSAQRNIFKLSEVLCQRDEKDLGPSLKDIHNIVNGHLAKPSPKRSPPTTPKTRRFKTYAKAASLDSRMQQSCVRCRQPAKVTEETTGEEWVECTSVSCCYQFCRFCQCERHPNKTCFRYDLDGPSPSKRKKKISAIGSKKSKKSLQRLLL